MTATGGSAAMTRDPRSVLGLIVGAVLVVVPITMGVEAARLAFQGLRPADSVLFDLGTHLLDASGWVMPTIGASILTAYVGLIPLARSDVQTAVHVRTAVRVLPWVCMAAALAAVLWCVFGAFALFRDVAYIGAFVGSALVASLTVVFAALAGAMLSIDARRSLELREDERASLRAEIGHIDPPPRLGAPVGWVILVAWALVSFVAPATAFMVRVGIPGGETENAASIIGLLLAAAFIGQLTPLGAAAFRGPYEVRWFELTVGSILYVLGVSVFVALTIAFAFFALALASSSDDRTDGLVLGVVFLTVAVALAVASCPGISRKVRWLRRWSIDAALDAIALRRLERGLARTEARIAEIEAFLVPAESAKSVRRFPWLRWGRRADQPQLPL